MLIRKFHLEDLNGCADILKQEYSKKPYNECFTDSNELNYIRSKTESNKDTCFVAVIDTKIVGFCFGAKSYWANGLQGIVEEIVVDSNYQGRGVGRELYFTLEKHLKENGAKSIILWVQNDSHAFMFHRKNGFFPSDNHSIMFKDI